MSLLLRSLKCVLALACTSTVLQCQPKDPGVRGGGAAAGTAIAGLTPAQAALFLDGQSAFDEVDSVSGTIAGEPGVGLGPSFNMNSCGGCHKFPATGGSAPAVNPQVALATLHGANNTVPSFITLKETSA